MPALLIRDGEKPVEGNPLAIGEIDCPKRDCTTSYILRSNVPLILYGREKSIDAMQAIGSCNNRGSAPSPRHEDLLLLGRRGDRLARSGN